MNVDVDKQILGLGVGLSVGNGFSAAIAGKDAARGVFGGIIFTAFTLILAAFGAGTLARAFMYLAILGFMLNDGITLVKELGKGGDIL